jgi:hypothetical protein
MKLIPKKKTEEIEKNSETEKIAGPTIARATPPDLDLNPSIRKIAELRRDEPAVRAIVRKSKMLADLITEEDLQVDARVIRDACEAEQHVYDPDTKRHVNKPDHKTRLAATTLRRAYHEGTPVKRQITLTGTFAGAEDVLERLKASPEALKAIAGAGVKLEIGGEVIDIEAEKVEDGD